MSVGDLFLIHTRVAVKAAVCGFNQASAPADVLSLLATLHEREREKEREYVNHPHKLCALVLVLSVCSSVSVPVLRCARSSKVVSAGFSVLAGFSLIVLLLYLGKSGVNDGGRGVLLMLALCLALH